MTRKLLLCAVIIIFFVRLTYSEWLPGNSSTPKPFSPGIDKTVTMTGEYSCRITISLPGLILNSENSVNRLAFFDSSPADYAPLITGFIALPPAGSVQCIVTACEYSAYATGETFGSEQTRKWDSALEYSAGEIFIGDPVILRDLRIAPIAVKPYKFDDNLRQIKVAKSVTFDISFSPEAGKNVKYSSRVPSRAFSPIYKSMVWNYDDWGIDEFVPVNYLVICPDALVNAVTGFVNWKNQKGVNTALVKFSEINANSSDPTIIKNYLQNAYDNWLNPPDYVLLVGDETVFPIYKTYTPDPPTPFSSYSLSGFYTDDNYYARLEGDDFFPDIYLGRFVVNTTTEAMLISNKILSYEKTPNIQQTDWYGHGVVCADQTEPSQRTTKLYVRNIMLNNGGFAQVDTLFEDGQASQLVNWMSSGRSFLNYRGSGWSNGWAGVGMYVGDVFDLTNHYKLPVVTGIGCGVAKFDEASACFGEAWMAAGTVNNPTGAVAFIGPTWNTHTLYNNVLDQKLYSALWTDSIRTIGPAFVTAKMGTYANYAPYIAVNSAVEEVVRTLFGQYTLLSDPELLTRAAPPLIVNIDCPDSVSLGESVLNITVLDNLNNPVPGAQVCAYIAGQVQSADYTGVAGTVPLTINPQNLPGELTITVSGLDIATVVRTIPLYTPGQFVSHTECAFRESIPGDSLIAPGETIILSDRAKNYGTQITSGVWCILTSTIPALSIAADSVFFGDFQPGEEKWGGGDFTFTLPVNYAPSTLPLKITYHDASGNSWYSDLFMEVHHSSLTLYSYTIDPGPDGLLERGGTAEIDVILKNLGDLPAYQTISQLVCLEPEVIVTQSGYNFGNILPGASGLNASNPYEFLVSNNCPMNMSAHFLLLITSGASGFTTTDTFNFTIEVGAASAIDPTTDEEGRYFAFENRDVIYAQSPQYRWVEISPALGGSGTEIEFSPSQQIVTFDLPFDWVYYGQSFDVISISADGFIVPDTLTLTQGPYYSIPFIDFAKGMVCPLWYDMYSMVFEPGDLSWYYDETEGSLRFEYHDWSHNNTNMQKENFQLVIYDPVVNPTPTGDSKIEFVYGQLTANALAGSIAGIESPSEMDGILIWDQGEFPPTSFAPQSFTSVLFTTESPQMVGVSENPGADKIIPDIVFLRPNYPNPFNPVTNIAFGLPKDGDVKLEIYNILGAKIAVLIDSKMSSGEHNVVWNASVCASGVYFIRLQTAGEIKTSKCLLIK